MMEFNNNLPESSSLEILIVTAVCEALAICIISTNISRYSEDRMFVFTGILVFSCVIMFIWIIAFFGVVFKSPFLMYSVYAIWISTALFWIFFVKGCITPTRCSESLWLVENHDRFETGNEELIEFYYRDTQVKNSGKSSENMQVDPEDDYEYYDEHEVTIEYYKMIEFIEFYVPWTSGMGATIYVMSFAFVLTFFVWTSILLKKYAKALHANMRAVHCKRQMAVYDCNKLRTYRNGKNNGMVDNQPDTKV